jgi:hypothetical protein
MYRKTLGEGAFALRPHVVDGLQAGFVHANLILRVVVQHRGGQARCCEISFLCVLEMPRRGDTPRAASCSWVVDTETESWRKEAANPLETSCRRSWSERRRTDDLTSFDRPHNPNEDRDSKRHVDHQTH